MLHIAYLLVAAGSAGCSWRSDGPSRLEQLHPTPEVGPEDAPPLPEVRIGEVGGDGPAGGWVLRIEEHGSMMLGEIGITNLFLARIPESEDEVRLTFCAQMVKLPVPGLGETGMSAQTVEAIGQAPLVLALDGPGPGTSGKLPSQEVAWTWGLKDMKDPLEEAIPTDASDPRVWDQDGDGNPGVTVHVLEPKGDRYMVRREVLDLSGGTFSEDGQWLEGKLRYRIDEAAVGYSGNSAVKTVAPITPEKEGNTYRFRRVAGAEDEGYDCAKLIAQHKGIFGETR